MSFLFSCTVWENTISSPSLALSVLYRSVGHVFPHSYLLRELRRQKEKDAPGNQPWMSDTESSSSSSYHDYQSPAARAAPSNTDFNASEDDYAWDDHEEELSFNESRSASPTLRPRFPPRSDTDPRILSAPDGPVEQDIEYYHTTEDPWPPRHPLSEESHQLEGGLPSKPLI